MMHYLVHSILKISHICRLIEEGYIIGDRISKIAVQNYVAPAIEMFGLTEVSEIGGTESIRV